MTASDTTILICDDSILARKQLSDAILASFPSVKIIEANNGQEAIDVYGKVHPSIVFLDIVMPVKDGIAAVREIIAQDPKADIIIVSSIGTQNQLKDAIESGARDFIQKPFSEAQVKKVLGLHIGEE